MFVAGGLMWANFTPSNDKLDENVALEISSELIRVTELNSYGWPYSVVAKCNISGQSNLRTVYGDAGSFAWNIATALAILFLAGLIAELGLRTEERRPVVALFALLALGALIFRPPSRSAPAIAFTQIPPPMIKKHSKYMNEAWASLEKGDVEDAKLSYDLAKSFQLSEYPECKALEKLFESKLKKLTGK